MYEISENLFKIQEKVDKIFRKILAKTVTKNGAKSLQKKNGCKCLQKRAQKKMAKLIKKINNFSLILNVNLFFITSDPAQVNKLIRTAK